MGKQNASRKIVLEADTMNVLPPPRIIREPDT